MSVNYLRAENEKGQEDTSYSAVFDGNDIRRSNCKIRRRLRHRRVFILHKWLGCGGSPYVDLLCLFVIASASPRWMILGRSPFLIPRRLASIVLVYRRLSSTVLNNWSATPVVVVVSIVILLVISIVVLLVIIVATTTTPFILPPIIRLVGIRCAPILIWVWLIPICIWPRGIRSTFPTATWALSILLWSLSMLCSCRILPWSVPYPYVAFFVILVDFLGNKNIPTERGQL